MAEIFRARSASLDAAYTFDKVKSGPSHQEDVRPGKEQQARHSVFRLWNASYRECKIERSYQKSRNKRQGARGVLQPKETKDIAPPAAPAVTAPVPLKIKGHRYEEYAQVDTLPSAQ